MTKKEFKAAMLRGLGRCAAAVEKDPEKYRDIVLWACKRDIAYDTQSEGTRDWFVHHLVSYYPDRTPFVEAAADALKRHKPNGSWDMSHIAGLLSRFMLDGDRTARKALRSKYRELLADMMACKRRKYPVFNELADLERLSLELSVGARSVLKIAEDLGRLYRTKSYMLDGDFAWLYSAWTERNPEQLAAAAKKSEDVACFVQREQAAREEMNNRRPPAPSERKGRMLSLWLKRNADAQTMAQYAARYREETDRELRAQALEVFACCAYPDDPAPILDDLNSDHEKLAQAALTALQNIRHPAVREAALNCAASGKMDCEWFEVFMKNYTVRDEPLLEKLMHDFLQAGDPHDLHAAYMSVLRLFYKEKGIPRPAKFLPLIYETNPCSFCREIAVDYMIRHRMMTDEILLECTHDSNDDIRRRANRILARRKKK